MKHWLSAFRLRTLPLAVSSILVGDALAFSWPPRGCNPHFSPWVLLFALLTAVLLQILSNLANDLGDHQHGTDNQDRIGPARAVQSGAIDPSVMKKGMIICGSLAFISGCALLAASFPPRAWVMPLLFLLLGLLAIGAAVKYTFGRNPYGYAGLGDVSVFLFFGLVGVCGTYYLQMLRFQSTTLLPAIGIGLLSAGVLNVNNMRDIVNDAACGKRTLVVRMGGPRARIYHTVLVLGGLGCLMLFTVQHFRSWPQWIFLLFAPGFLMHLLRVWKNTDPRALDPQLKVLALGTFATALLFTAGLIFAA